MTGRSEMSSHLDFDESAKITAVCFLEEEASQVFSAFFIVVLVRFDYKQPLQEHIQEDVTRFHTKSSINNYYTS